MKPNLEIINEYLSGELDEKQKGEVEMQIANNEAFAKEFTMILLAKKAAKEEAATIRKAEFESLRTKMASKPVGGPIGFFPNNNMVKIAMAASLALIIGFFWIFNQTETPQNLANNYIETKLNKLPVMMSAADDSLTKAINFYNKKEYTQAKPIFEKLSKNEPKAMEYLGLTNLQLEQYDEAIAIFKALSTNKTYTSRAKLLWALSLIKKGDKQQYYEILKGIDKNDLSLEDREFVEEMAISNY